MYREELSDCLSRRSNLVRSLEEGIPPSAVMESLTRLEERIGELEGLAAYEDFKADSFEDEEAIRALVGEIVGRVGNDPAKEGLLVSTFVRAVYADRDTAIIVFEVDGGDGSGFGFEYAKALKEANPAEPDGPVGVRKLDLWWS